MKNLIPLMALLVMSGTFVAPAAMASGDKCTGASSCCKHCTKKCSKYCAKKCSKKASIKGASKDTMGADTKAADTK